MSVTNEAAASAVTKAATAAQYGGAGGAVAFGLAANEFAALVGLAIGFAGFLVNWRYQHKMLKVAEKRSEGE